MKSLFKSDFSKDSFLTFMLNTIGDDHQLREIMLAYRLARYAFLNKYHKDIEEPKTAVKILIKDFKMTNVNSIITLLLCYVSKCSYLLSAEDVFEMFGKATAKKVELVLTIDKIVNSGAHITDVKIKKYQQLFCKDVIIISAASTLATMKLLTLSEAKSYPIKLYERYLPIYNIEKDIRKIVFVKFSKLLMQKVNKAQKDKNYSITSGDIFKYWTILNDRLHPHTVTIRT
jgi:hypothetical protein